MAGIDSRLPRDDRGNERLRRHVVDNVQSGQVLLDALIAVAVIAGGLLSVAHTCHALVRAAEERHQEVLRSLETANGLACERRTNRGR